MNQLSSKFQTDLVGANEDLSISLLVSNNILVMSLAASFLSAGMGYMVEFRF